MGAAASAGAAWGAVKVSLNGTRPRVKHIEANLRQHFIDEMEEYRLANDRMAKQDDRLARLETKIDLILIDKKLT